MVTPVLFPYDSNTGFVSFLGSSFYFSPPRRFNPITAAKCPDHKVVYIVTELWNYHSSTFDNRFSYFLARTVTKLSSWTENSPTKLDARRWSVERDWSGKRFTLFSIQGFKDKHELLTFFIVNFAIGKNTFNSANYIIKPTVRISGLIFLQPVTEKYCLLISHNTIGEDAKCNGRKTLYGLCSILKVIGSKWSQRLTMRVVWQSDVVYHRYDSMFGSLLPTSSRPTSIKGHLNIGFSRE